MLNKYDLELYQMKAELCKTFSDPKRLIIIGELRHGEKTVEEQTKILETSQAAVSQHMAVLRQRNVVKTRRQGTNVYYRLADPKISEACKIVHQVVMNQVRQSREFVENLL